MRQPLGPVGLPAPRPRDTAATADPAHTSTGSSTLLAANDEARVFWALRRRLLTNTIGLALANSRLRMAIVSLLTVMLWMGLFALFTEAFHFLAEAIDSPGVHDRTIRAVFSVFFAALTIMLVFSTGIVLYGSLFRSREVTYLLTTPANVERIFVHKFQEAMFFSNWAFLLLGTPLLVAHGLAEGDGLVYFVLMVPLLVAFAYLPGCVGAIACLWLVRYFPNNRRHFLAATSALAALAAVWLGWSLLDSRGDLLTPSWFQEMLARVRFSENRLLPSWWLSSALVEAGRAGWQNETARRALAECFMFFSLTLANALFLHLAATAVAGRLLPAGHQALASERVQRVGHGAAWIDRCVMWCAAPLGPRMRLLIVKDVRLFRRDPLQWLQLLIFFGLFGLYFTNTPRLGYAGTGAVWVNLISFLNLALVGLLMSAFTTRFVFPMISLEGRRFWILGLLPIRRETILWSKFLFAAAGSAVPSTGLILLGDWALGVTRLVVLAHALVCLVLCSGLAAIAVGLGAMMPNLREQAPSKIAAGFGGTLNLVISTAYIVAVIVLTAVPCHFYVAISSAEGPVPWANAETIRFWLAAGAGASLLLGVVATALPLLLGFRAFRRLEF